MICWCEGCHLVPVHGVLQEKPLHLLSHLEGKGHTGFELERQERLEAEALLLGDINSQQVPAPPLAFPNSSMETYQLG